jgi:hypothetical protein
VRNFLGLLLLRGCFLWSLIFSSLALDVLDDAPSEKLRSGHVLLFA